MHLYLCFSSRPGYGKGKVFLSHFSVVSPSRFSIFVPINGSHAFIFCASMLCLRCRTKTSLLHISGVFHILNGERSVCKHVIHCFFGSLSDQIIMINVLPPQYDISVDFRSSLFICAVSKNGVSRLPLANPLL